MHNNPTAPLPNPLSTYRPINHRPQKPTPNRTIRTVPQHPLERTHPVPKPALHKHPRRDRPRTIIRMHLRTRHLPLAPSPLEVNPRRHGDAIILALRRSQLADLLRLAIVGARRRVVAPRLARVVVLEDGVVGLEEDGEVVPECRGELDGGGVGVGGDNWGSHQGPVGLFDRVVFLPRRPGLVCRRGDVGDVDGEVEDGEGYGVD